MKRSAGILLPISSLPSKYGIGCFDKEAYNFVDFLKSAGQSYWQILPVGPTSYGDSPYQSFSTFAGNPYFISLDEFVEKDFISEKDCKEINFGENPERVDYEKLYLNRYVILKKAFKNSRISTDNEYINFCGKNEWLDNYALFMALKDKFSGVSWCDWDSDIRQRDNSILEKYRTELSEQTEFYKFLQYYFYRQWSRLKKYANKNEVQIIGDIPIYVAYDSADVWESPELFQLDDKGFPKAVAGCPPDGFSADGQLWGNPLYDWEYHEKTGFRWWISRLEHCFKLYDIVRIDHFRGFDEYYSVPFGDKTARNGHWEKGPGMKLFDAVQNALGRKEIIAEDLGFMTDSVRKLVADSGFPNMKVLEFAFDSRDTGSRNDYLPHNYSENCVAYTGTHDNQTIASWFKTISDAERRAARDYLCDYYTPDERLHKSFISLIMRSRAELCIIPMQDWLGLEDDARMNIPSTVGNNWKWRMRKTDMYDITAKEICKITRIYSR